MPAETMHEPTAPSIRSDEHDKIAKLQRELEKAQFDAQQKEEFGKYDLTVPGKGEGNYQEYIDSRPNDGIVRNGDVYQYADTGKFAGEAAYATQNGTAEDHYDKVEKVSISGDQYKEMGVMQLAKEAATARKDDNKAREGLIFEALEHHLTMDAMKDDSESPVEAQARYESEVARFEQLVTKFAESAVIEPSISTPDTADEDEQPVTTNAQSAPVAATEADIEPAVDAAATLKSSEVVLNGETVQIENVFVSPDEKRIVEISGDDVTVRYIPEDKLIFKPPTPSSDPQFTPMLRTAATQRMKSKLQANVQDAQVPEDQPAQPAASAFAVGGDDAISITDPAIRAESPRPAAFAISGQGEVEVLDDERKEQIQHIEADPRVAQEQEAARALAESEQKFTERVKNWFQKEGKKVQEYGGLIYMGKLFRDGMNGVKNGGNRMLEWRVKEDMTPEQKDKIRKQNRYGAIAFGAAAAALTIGILAANGMSSNDAGIDSEVVPTPTETVDPSVQDVLNPGGAAGGESQMSAGPPNRIPEWDGPGGDSRVGSDLGASEVTQVPEAAAASEVFNIPANGRLEDVFRSLGIDTAKIYANYDTLTKLPDFYGEAGDVRITNPGWLSQAAQDAINALK